MMMTDVEKRISMQCNMLFPRAWLDQPSSKDPKRTNEEQMVALFKERIIETPVQPRSGVIGQLSAVVRHHIGRDRLINIRDTGIPILVCTGTDDKLIRPSNSYYIADVLQARLEVFQDCGHVLSLQEPERYNNLLLEHFRSIKPVKIITTE
jgi:pimeloyl-ACP methyl ester carboxylesterase